jgi:hypothetical protein
MSAEGAIEVFERTLVAGTRSDDAADGGGRTDKPLLGRGGAGMEPKVGGFRRGGLDGAGRVMLGSGGWRSISSGGVIARCRGTVEGLIEIVGVSSSTTAASSSPSRRGDDFSSLGCPVDAVFT